MDALRLEDLNARAGELLVGRTVAKVGYRLFVNAPVDLDVSIIEGGDG